MTGSGENGKKPNKLRQTSAREARLAAALRQNLRRRKAQERARGAAAPEDDPEASVRPAQNDENR